MSAPEDASIPLSAALPGITGRALFNLCATHQLTGGMAARWDNLSASDQHRWACAALDLRIELRASILRALAL